MSRFYSQPFTGQNEPLPAWARQLRNLRVTHEIRPSRLEINPPELSGYLGINKKTNGQNQGSELVDTLIGLGINLPCGPPFVSVLKGKDFVKRGVIKIINFPFTTTLQEVIVFINRHSKKSMIKKHKDGYPVHITMDKVTGKTMECFVEFPSVDLARNCVERIEALENSGKLPRIGTRYVITELSNQAELMEAIFRRARIVDFDVETGEPRISTEDHRQQGWTNGFRGFFTMEEMYGTFKFATNPGRSPFTQDCNSRVYEAMISTLYKFPWPAAAMYSVGARNAIYETVFKLITLLTSKVDLPIPIGPRNVRIKHENLDVTIFNPTKPTREVGLSQNLLVDLLTAAVNVPSFSQLQKVALCAAASTVGAGISLSPFATHWPFQTLEASQDATDEAVKFWLELFDTGYQLRSSRIQPTTFEKYIMFSRNKAGFVIGEWTIDGLELPFGVATCLEYQVMMVYVDEACQHWCFERRLNISPFNTMTIQQFIDKVKYEDPIQIVLDDTNEVPFPRQLTNPFMDDYTVSCRVSAQQHMFEPAYTADLGLKRFPPKKSVFNPATATEFVPRALQIRDSTSSANSGPTRVTASDTSHATTSKLGRSHSEIAQHNSFGNAPAFINPWNPGSNVGMEQTHHPPIRNQGVNARGPSISNVESNTYTTPVIAVRHQPQTPERPPNSVQKDVQPVFHLPAFLRNSIENYSDFDAEIRSRVSFEASLSPRSHPTPAMKLPPPPSIGPMVKNANDVLTAARPLKLNDNSNSPAYNPRHDIGAIGEHLRRFIPSQVSAYNNPEIHSSGTIADLVQSKRFGQQMGSGIAHGTSPVSASATGITDERNFIDKVRVSGSTYKFSGANASANAVAGPTPPTTPAVPPGFAGPTVPAPGGGRMHPPPQHPFESANCLSAAELWARINGKFEEDRK